MSIEDIRRKHEAWKRLYGKGWSTSGLSVADADRLFAALDSLQKEYDQYKEMVGESLMKEVKRLDKELDAERGKVEKARKWIREARWVELEEIIFGKEGA